MQNPADSPEAKAAARRPTLADVARLADVSLGSASRALSVPDQVKPATLARVNRAVAQLGYIRDGAARALASRRTHTVAAIYPTLNNPIFAHSTHAMQQALWARGYQLLIASHEYHVYDEAALLRATLERGVDGVIMVGTQHHDAVFALLRQRNLPYVLTWSVDDTQHPYCVGISNRDAAHRLAAHVLAHGHTRLAICGGDPQHNERARGRRDGALDAIAQAGLSVPEDWIVEEEFSYAGGRRAIARLWALPHRPTAILFGTDLQAMGALDECRRRGISVPGDVSIVGFDGIEEGAMMQPSLTTMRIPAHEIGRRAADLMAGLLEGSAVAAPPPLQGDIFCGDSLGAA